MNHFLDPKQEASQKPPPPHTLKISLNGAKVFLTDSAQSRINTIQIWLLPAAYHYTEISCHILPCIMHFFAQNCERKLRMHGVFGTDMWVRIIHGKTRYFGILKLAE